MPLLVTKSLLFFCLYLNSQGRNNGKWKPEYFGNCESLFQERFMMPKRRRRASNASNSSSLSRQNTEQELLLHLDENKIRYAKRKKPQGWISISIQVCGEYS